MRTLNLRQPDRGFTIIELIVAISLLGLVIFLINTLFFQTQAAVSVGIRTGDMLVESEGIADSLQRDVGAMRGPKHNFTVGDASSAPGFLVIVQKRYNNVPVKQRSGKVVPQNVRSDQLVFLTTGPVKSRTPQNSNRLGSDVNAKAGRVWYGHVLKTDKDGATAGDLGQDGPNRFANDWILGRQALLLADASDPASNFNTGSDTFAASARSNAAVSNTNATISPTKLYMGLTDVANKPLTQGPANPGGNPTGLVDAAQINTPGYPTGVYPYTYAANRLRMNPVPAPNTNGNADFASWKIAQTHSELADHVSDFIVEFAGDYETNGGGGGGPDGKIDRYQDSNNNYHIKWYTAPAFVNKPTKGGSNDPTAPLTFDADMTGAFASSTGPPVDGTSHNQAYLDTSPGLANADAIFVWRQDDDDAYSYGTGSPPGPGSGPNSKWPYLIRLRYRLQDTDGRVQSHVVNANTGDETPITGHWFEQIIKVKRPQ